METTQGQTLRRFLGVDPGTAGGIAIVAEDGSEYEAWKMPDTRHDLAELILDLHGRFPNLVAVVEQVHSMPGQGVKSMFTFGQNYERPLMALCALRIRHDEVRPRDWQKALGIPPAATTAKKRGIPETKDEEKARKTKNAKAKRDHKKKLKAVAQGLFPDVRVTDAKSDALLLAEYLRRREVGS